jgi:hypothetical protein
MRFDVKDEASAISRLGDQVFAQPTTQGEAAARSLLQAELQHLTPEQLRQVKAEIDNRITEDKSAIKSLDHQAVETDNPLVAQQLRLQLEQTKEKLNHQPSLSLVTNRDDIYGVNVQEKGRDTIYIPVLKGKD